MADVLPELAAPGAAGVRGKNGAARKPRKEVRPIESLGDMSILINPATEAYQFRRIDALYRQLSYPAQQTPQLVVFSADNDWVRQTFFPIERTLTLAFRPTFRSNTGIFEENFRSFLSSYIAFVEAKRFLWRDLENKELPASGKKQPADPGVRDPC